MTSGSLGEFGQVGKRMESSESGVLVLDLVSALAFSCCEHQHLSCGGEVSSAVLSDA